MTYETVSAKIVLVQSPIKITADVHFHCAMHFSKADPPSEAHGSHRSTLGHPFTFTKHCLDLFLFSWPVGNYMCICRLNQRATMVPDHSRIFKGRIADQHLTPVSIGISISTQITINIYFQESTDAHLFPFS